MLEIDDTEKVIHEQHRIILSEDACKDVFTSKDIVLRSKKQSRGSSLSVSKSEDLVDEELANMEQVESLNVLPSSVCDDYIVTVVYLY